MRLFSIMAIILISTNALAKDKPALPALYPPEERRLFMKGCVNGNNIMFTFCQCVLGKFQDTMTFKDYAAMNTLTDEQLRTHKHYASAILTCAKVPPKKK